LWFKCREGILRARRVECRLWNLSRRLLNLCWSMLLILNMCGDVGIMLIEIHFR
jgi:hypothetical protein